MGTRCCELSAPLPYIFQSTITSQNFEEPIRLQNDTMRNVIQSHAHEAKSADYAIYGRVARDGVVCVSSSFAHLGLREMSGRLKSESAFFTHTGYRDKLADHLLALAGIPIN